MSPGRKRGGFGHAAADDDSAERKCVDGFTQLQRGLDRHEISLRRSYLGTCFWEKTAIGSFWDETGRLASDSPRSALGSRQQVTGLL